MISRVIMLIISILTLLGLFVWSGELAILGFSVILLGLFIMGIIINIITVKAISYDVELNNDTSGTQCLSLKINVKNKCWI